MLWMVHHRWPVEAWFAFNCYNHWEHLLLCWTREEPIITLIRERFMQGDPIFMFLYGITLLPLVEKLLEAVLDLLASFYADNAAFNGPAERSSELMKLLLERGLARVYLAELSK